MENQDNQELSVLKKINGTLLWIAIILTLIFALLFYTYTKVQNLFN